MSGLVASGLSVTQVFSRGRTSAAVQLMWWAAEPRLSRGLSQGEMPVLRAGPGLRRCFRARLCVGATETGVSCRNPETARAGRGTAAGATIRSKRAEHG